MVNYNNLKMVRDAIAEAPEEKMNMTTFFHREGSDAKTIGDLRTHCGTAGCIAGWATAVFRPEVEIKSSIFTIKIADMARVMLGLDRFQSHSLFYAIGIGYDKIAELGSKRAVLHQLDWILAGNEPDWTVTCRELSKADEVYEEDEADEVYEVYEEDEADEVASITIVE